MTAYLSAAGIGAVALTIGLVLFFKKAGKKLVPWFMLVAGLSLAGAAGAGLDRAAAVLARTTESASARLLGVGLPLLVTVVVTIVLFIHMKPKGQPPTRFTPWLALIFPSLLVATGLGALASLAASVSGQVGTSAWAMISQVIAGR